MAETPAPAPSATPAHRRLPAAVLWDFDGTLVDSEPLWVRAQYALADALGFAWSDELAGRLVGNALPTSGAIISEQAARCGVALDPAAAVERLVATVADLLRGGPVDWRPGALALLDSLAAVDVPCALVSASYRPVLDAALDRLSPSPFRVVVSGDTVSEGKPHPESYLVACERLGVHARDCVVIEDSVPGVTAGQASGAFVVGVRHHVPLDPAPRRVVIDTLVGVDADRLGEWAGGAA